VTVALTNPLLQTLDGSGLVTGRFELTDDLEPAVQAWDVERHGNNRTPRL